MKKLLLLPLLICYSLAGRAQLTQHMGWFFLSHQQKINSKFDILADVQLRSANQFSYLNTLLLRTELNYNFNKKHAVALGYAYKGDWEYDDAAKAYTLENRIFEQYLYKTKLHRTELTLRTRLEQRWVKEEKVDFSQRGRAFISAQIPLFADTGFTRGWYTGIQNELFINVSHKQRVNGRRFDQNRSLVAFGYRWSKNIDTELGYQYWYQQEMDNTYRRHVFQLMVTTQF